MASIDATNTSVVLNGHTCTGFSEDTDAVTLPEIELGTVTRGANGDMVGHSSGNRGGEVKLKFLPTSRTHFFLQRQMQRQMAGQEVRWDGSIEYRTTNASVRLENGRMTMGQSGTTVGKGAASSVVYTFEFEELVSNFDGARA